MHNWDYDLTTLDGSEEAERWKLERLILYGLGGEKIKRDTLARHLPTIREHIPEDHFAFLSLLLHA